MMGFAVIVGSVLAGWRMPGFPPLNVEYGFITGFMLTAGSMVANDYYDRRIDAVNEPNRPIPKGLIKPGQALAFALFLALIGFAAAYLTSLLSLALAAVSLILFTVYTTVGKRSGLPGNFLVSTCVAVPFVYGSVVATDAVQLNVLVFVSMVFLSNTGREVTKGIVDTQGDKSQNVRTIAVRFGDKVAAILAAAFYVAATLLSPVPVVLGMVSNWFIPVVCITDIGLIASSISLLRNHSRANSRRIKNLVLLWFVIGLLAFLIGAIR